MNPDTENVKTAPHYYWGCCMVCGATSNRSDDAFKTTTLKRCSRCHCVAYCSVEHQKLHWKYHKSLCNYLSAAAGDVGADTFFAAGTGRSNKFTCNYSLQSLRAPPAAKHADQSIDHNSYPPPGKKVVQASAKRGGLRD